VLGRQERQVSEESIEELVLDSVRRDALLADGETLVVMLSGGRDSVCLADLATRLRGCDRVLAMHVNYGLRPESAHEERHCAELCEELGIRLQISHAGPPAPGNIQAWARELRYRKAEALARAGDGLMATGHTSTDQVETVLYRLAASPGRRALLGMSPREGRLVRPLLGLTREQTASYCRARGLSWCEDPSNESDRYARGRVRARLLPAVRAIHPAAEANILRTSVLLREETELLEGLVDAELDGRATVSLARLAQMPPALARLVLVRLAERTARGLVPQAGERLAELLALARRGGPAELHVGGRVGAVIERGMLSMVKLPPRDGPPED
jgi:tRNA(Ile)-lysidine synthase